MNAAAYVPYSDAVEQIDPDESETFDKVIRVMAEGGKIASERCGRPLRPSHAKAYALLIGELRVLEGLPSHLRQGLFATPRRYPVVVRMAQVPGEFLDDRRVSTPRGMAIKVMDVEGPRLPGQEGAGTQDFVLDTGKAFIVGTASAFLAAITATEMATPLPERVKAAVSTVSRAANAALRAVGLESANLDFFGHPFRHPLAEPFFSQAAMRYGAYVAKLGVFPATPALVSLADQTFEPQDENGLRTAAVAYFRERGAEYDVRVQLCTDLDKMPVEDAGKEWPEDESPYQSVARLVLPSQDAYSAANERMIDRDLSFCPSHSLEAHRPLGSIMRCRMRAYEELGKARRAASGSSLAEPQPSSSSMQRDAG